MILTPSRSSARSACKPRASGDDPRQEEEPPAPVRVNPARAGMIPAHDCADISQVGKPRASGDDPRLNLLVDLLLE